LPSVEPALDLDAFVDEFDASVLPAFESDAFEGLPELADFAIFVLRIISFPERNLVSDFEMCLPMSVLEFNWKYGQIPDSLSARDDCLWASWDLGSDAAESNATAGVASADLPSQLNEDEQRNLISGVFVGIAGSATFAFLRELLTPGWYAPLRRLVSNEDRSLASQIPDANLSADTKPARMSSGRLRLRSYRANKLPRSKLR
jgi:hypothetical protein